MSQQRRSRMFWIPPVQGKFYVKVAKDWFYLPWIEGAAHTDTCTTEIPSWALMQSSSSDRDIVVDGTLSTRWSVHVRHQLS